MRLVIDKYCASGHGYMMTCTPINTSGTTLSQVELKEEVINAFKSMRCLYGEFGHPHKQDNQSHDEYLKRCLENDDTRTCISFQGFSETRDGKVVIYFDFSGGQADAFEEALQNKSVDLGSRTLITDPLTYITFDVIRKLN